MVNTKRAAAATSSDVIGEELCWYWFAEACSFGFGFESLDLIA
jgi:hypothetical protein